MMSLEKSDVFGPEWRLSLNVAPVVKNGLTDLFRLDKNVIIQAIHEQGIRVYQPSGCYLHQSKK